MKSTSLKGFAKLFYIKESKKTLDLECNIWLHGSTLYQYIPPTPPMPADMSTERMMQIDKIVATQQVPTYLKDRADELRFQLSSRAQIGIDARFLDRNILDLHATLKGICNSDNK